MQQINIKDLTLISDDGMSWFDDENDNTIVFPTIESFMNAVVEYGKEDEQSTNFMKMRTTKLKESINILGSIENVVKHTLASFDDTEETVDIPIDAYDIMFDFINYCIASGTHSEEITKYIIDDLFRDSDLEQNRISKTATGYVFIDPEAKDTIWFMNDDEYSIEHEMFLYKLSPDEQEELKKQIENPDINLWDSKLYIKAWALVLEEILQLFG